MAVNPASTRIKGTKLSLNLGATPTDYWQDISAYSVENEEADSDVTTFADAAAGGARQFLLKGTAIQSTDATSFWNYVWTSTGLTVPFTLAPWGNTTPSVSQPHVIGTVTIGPKPTIGGEAGTGAFTFDFEWKIVGTPTLKTT